MLQSVVRGQYVAVPRKACIARVSCPLLAFCAFDILVEGSDDLRKLPLHLRRTSLQRLLARRPEGIFVNPYECGEIGPELFRVACQIGLEGLVSKHRERPYQAR